MTVGIQPSTLPLKVIAGKVDWPHQPFIVRDRSHAERLVDDGNEPVDLAANQRLHGPPRLT